MHWKSEARDVSEEGHGDGSIKCPVCNLVLRRDVVLQDHLNTHPKQEVIEALIQLNDSLRESCNSRRSSIITPVPASAPDESHSTVSVTIDGEPAEAQCESPVVSTLPSTTHQLQITSSLPSSSGNHFISFPPFLSSSGIHQFISLPLVASSNPSSNQASMLPLLYNPFVYPSSASVSAEQIEGTPHLQYLNSSNILRPSFQIIQANNNSISPSLSPYAETDPLGESSLVALHNSDGDADVSVEITSESEEPSHTTTFDEEDNEAKVGYDNVAPCCNSPERQVQEWNTVGPSASDTISSSQENLQFQSDQGSSTAASSTTITNDEAAEESDTEVDEKDVKVALTPFTTHSLEVTHRPVIVHVGSSKKCSPCSEAQKVTPNVENSNSSSETPVAAHVAEPNVPASEDRVSVSDSSAESTGIEGLHFLVPSHFLENISKCDQSTEPLSPGRPLSPPCDSSPASPYQKSVDSPTVPINIQTDETMPPRGELSEQESIGGNSSSMWSVPPYHMTRELLSPVVSTSFDLTARESWAGSDISDCEGNANQAPDTSLYKFTTTPSFSNTIPHLLPKAGEEYCQDQKPILLQNQGKGKGSNKPPPKPRVYKCKACSLEFACPKERRVHPCEKKKESKTKVSSTERAQLVVQTMSVSDFNVVVAGSSTTQQKECPPPKPKRKYSRKPKAGDIKKETVEVISTEQHLRELGPTGQFEFSENGLAGNSQVSARWSPEQLSDARPIGQSQSSLVCYDAQRIEKFENVDIPEMNTSYQSVHTSEQGCAQSGDLAFQVTPVLMDDRQLINNDYFNVKRCIECNLIFANSKDLSRHLVLKHKVNKYQCTTCGESFEKESAYYEHLNVHPLECRLCGKCFHRRKSLNLHMKWHMDVKPYKCDSCEKSFVTRQKLDEHQNTHTGNAPIKCPFCEETFKRYSNLIQHKNRHHLNIKRKVKDYICHCGEVFQSKKKLEWHKEIHDNKPKSCPFCSEKFVHTSSLTRHVRKAHDKRYVPKAEREGENVECPVCHRVFLKSSLATHLRVHTGERPFSCHICGKDFTTKWNLQHHKWTHASRSSKPFKCTLCKAAFYRKQDYNGHMRSHRNVRPFTCNHCGCQFIRKYNCLRHMKEHESDKKYTCTICNKTFHRGYYLKDHMRVHDGSRPFSCHICGKASTTKSNHNKHVRIHHAREPQNTEI